MSGPVIDNASTQITDKALIELVRRLDPFFKSRTSASGRAGTGVPPLTVSTISAVAQVASPIVGTLDAGDYTVTLGNNDSHEQRLRIEGGTNVSTYWREYDLVLGDGSVGNDLNGTITIGDGGQFYGTSLTVDIGDGGLWYRHSERFTLGDDAALRLDEINSTTIGMNGYFRGPDWALTVDASNIDTRLHTATIVADGVAKLYGLKWDIRKNSGSGDVLSRIYAHSDSGDATALELEADSTSGVAYGLVNKSDLNQIGTIYGGGGVFVGDPLGVAQGLTVNLLTGQSLLVLDSSFAAVFEVREDGSVHILTGTTVQADL